VQHALLFTFVIVFIVAVLTASTYTVVMNMMTDAYRYEKVIEKSNEKVRLVAAVGTSGLVYGIRNVGLTETVILEAGVVFPDGNKRTLVSSRTLSPGELITGSDLYATSAITFYAITSRGNVFTTDVVDLRPGTYGRYTLFIRDLIPGIMVFESPIKYGDNYVYTASLAMYGYAFAFLVVDDPHSDESVYVKIGPVNIANLYKNRIIPYREQVRRGTRNLGVDMSLYLYIESYDTENIYPHYKLNVPIEVYRQDDRTGLVIYGCFGFIWRTMTSNMFGFTLINPLNEKVIYSGSNYYFENAYKLTLIPSALDIDSLVASLANPNTQSFTVSTPSGSQVYILLANCFRIEDIELSGFTTQYAVSVPGRNFAYSINPNLVFPGTVQFNNKILDLSSIRLEVVFSPEIYILTALNNI